MRLKRSKANKSEVHDSCSSGVLLRVDWQMVTDVLKDLCIFIFRDKWFAASCTWADYHPWSTCGMTSNCKECTIAVGLLNCIPDICGWNQKWANIISKVTANCGVCPNISCPVTKTVLLIMQI